MEQLRVQLQSINQKIFQLFSERKKLVRAIIDQKQGQMIYHPQQEWQVFQQHKLILKKMRLCELLSFSLLMESHAQTEDSDYPQWSLGVHLVGNHSGLVYQTNPLLLKTVNPELLIPLPIKAEFLARWENLW